MGRQDMGNQQDVECMIYKQELMIEVGREIQFNLFFFFKYSQEDTFRSKLQRWI